MVEGEEESEKEEIEEHEEYADEGEILVIRRLLNSNLVNEDPWLRENYDHGRDLLVHGLHGSDPMHVFHVSQSELKAIC